MPAVSRWSRNNRGVVEVVGVGVGVVEVAGVAAVGGAAVAGGAARGGAGRPATAGSGNVKAMASSRT